MPQKLPKPLIRSVLCCALVLIALVVLVAAGVITPRAFGILCVVAIVSFGLVFYRLLRNIVPPSTRTERTPAWSRRRRGYFVSAAFLWLVFALWLTRGGAWLPRLVGSTVVIVFVAAFVMARSKDRSVSERPAIRK
jgi:hypothetical protein